MRRKGMGKAIRAVLEERLTPTQYRRLALLYGFDTLPLNLSQVARREGVSAPAVRKSREAAMEQLREGPPDWRLWALWLMIGYRKGSE